MSERDPAAQPERTRLAWRRTVLTATVVALLGLRHLASEHLDVNGIMLACLLAFSWLALAVGAQTRIQTLSRPDPVSLPGWWPALAGGTVLAIVALAGATIVT